MKHATRSWVKGILLATVLVVPAVCRAEESPAEKTARDWFMAICQGENDKVWKLSRVPFAMGEYPITTAQQMQEIVFKVIMGAKKKLGKNKIPPEAVQVTTLAKIKNLNPKETALLDYVAAHTFVELSVGEFKTVIFLTKGVKPKVVGLGKSEE